MKAKDYTITSNFDIELHSFKTAFCFASVLPSPFIHHPLLLT